ncbi:MAG: CvpA family protein [Eubacterium sp.]|nr:CvpA family protein [Eubacterium sp.]
MYTHIIEGIVALIIILCAVDGWRKGLILKLFGFLRFLLMIILTILLTPLLYKILPLEPGMREGAAVLLALIVSVVGLTVISRLLHIVDHIPVVRTINHFGGLLVGLLFGFLAVWVALVVFNAFRDIDFCRTVIHYAKQSPALFWLLHFDPIAFLTNSF